MKKIGLTQRVEVIEAYQERRDCLDQNWVRLLLDLGFMPVLLPNIIPVTDIKEYLDQLALDGVILTGGNDLSWTQSDRAAQERDLFEQHLLAYCEQNKLPVLGVCRGMQMLNIYLGGQLQTIENHVSKSHQINFSNGESYQVNSYHDWGIAQENLAAPLEAIGLAADGSVEYCRHINQRMTGIMWHPERDNQDQDIGLQIIKETFL